jgi:aminoglycoside phosphotransferase family enzyme/predicted kinase
MSIIGSRPVLDVSAGPVPGVRAPSGDTAPAATETHCATLFFAGNRVWKFKKPLDLGFVDFRTGESRRRACRREVELNRQFAPDVYLGVVAVGPEGEPPCDWAVVMRRMPPERRLSALIASGEDVSDPVRELARQLAVHHASARRSPAIDTAGTPEELRRRWSNNLDAIRAFQGTVLDDETIQEMAHLALRYICGRRPLLEERVASGRIRDGHGDLLADDIFCLDDGPRALDCLEFDDYLRSVDGLDDAACLAMDLERLGAGALAERFLDWFAELSGESRVDSLVHHYIAYRAVVRLKVACLRWEQDDESARVLARRFAGIALRHLRAAEPRLILIGGSPGTGKSTLSAELADRLGAVLLRSDRIRKEQAGIVPEHCSPEPWRHGLYAPSVTQDTYDHLIDLARRLLAHGETVILDASWSTGGERAQARLMAADAFAAVAEIRCCADTSVVDQRIRGRQGTHDASDATPPIARLMEKEFRPWPEAIELDTTGTVDQTVVRALQIVRPR